MFTAAISFEVTKYTRFMNPPTCNNLSGTSICQTSPGTNSYNNLSTIAASERAYHLLDIKGQQTKLENT